MTVSDTKYFFQDASFVTKLSYIYTQSFPDSVFFALSESFYYAVTILRNVHPLIFSSRYSLNSSTRYFYQLFITLFAIIVDRFSHLDISFIPFIPVFTRVIIFEFFFSKIKFQFFQ